MEMRFQIDRLIIIAVGCALTVPVIRSSFEIPIVPYVGAAVFVGMLIRHLVKRSFRAMLMLTAFAGLIAIAEPILLFVSKTAISPQRVLGLAEVEIPALACAYCAFDLWTEWSKPNKPPLQTSTSGTLTAGAPVSPPPGAIDR